MEKRKISLTSLKACRFCLAQNDSLTSLYDRKMIPKNSVTLPLQIMSCVSVEVFPSDRMPSQICERCRYFMDLFYRFKQICRQADESIMQYVQLGEVLEPVMWHNKLTRVFRSGNQSPAKRQDRKATPKPNSTEEFESDEDNENVYNIKIGDGPDDDGKESTCIKVVKTGDRLHITKDENKGKKEFLSKSPRNARSLSERTFQCKYCDKSFVKSHHYTRHIRVKHKNVLVSPHGPFGGGHQYSCEQCDETFVTQDELIYHSAKHAAENLTCPLCHEQFNLVEEVSAHIKTHVDGAEYMCDLCELVFTSKEKLDQHLIEKHEDEINQEHELGLDEESMELDEEDDDDNSSINVKDAGDHMLVEIKKPADFIKRQADVKEGKGEHTPSEESEAEATYTELATVDTIALAKEAAAPPKPPAKPLAPKRTDKPLDKPDQIAAHAAILRKAEEMKRKSPQKPLNITSDVTLVKTPNKVESANTSTSTGTSTAGASDKSLRLLEKELQELQRTNNPSEPVKSQPKSAEARGRRPLLHTSTPKPKPEERKAASKLTPVLEKKQPERRPVTKENKEPKEKEPKANNNKEEKDKDKESKEQKEVQAKSIVKIGAAADSQSADDSVRRSSRPAKVKDYAKMVRDKGSSDDSDSDDDDEYTEVDKVPERSSRAKKPVGKPAPAHKPVPVPASPAHDAPAAAPASAPRKRGRPRKNPSKEVPAKVKKANEEEEGEGETASDVRADKEAELEGRSKSEGAGKEAPPAADDDKKSAHTKDTSPTKAPEKDNLMVSPSGQTLKKVPIKSLPPGVKPMPLPLNAVRNVGSGLCEMQIGTKVVKVQKIVMTKAEVEAMKNQGLLEMKDGTMVLKQGIKLPTSDAASLKSSLVGNDATKESPSKKDKATPTRCTLDEDAV